jgi:osmotically inducible lipoprotein OsmB
LATSAGVFSKIARLESAYLPGGAKEKQVKTAMALLIVTVLGMGGCAGMSNTEQRVLSGGAMGATGGAVIGALAGSAAIGAAAGGGAGLLGGYVYDQYQKSRGTP